ncbi:T6SS immunity protein Tli4 family protein [Rugamonas rubra]|uniref:Tle cognate immunity protein 4 C-terminal domain-containing protein n=1 Tax=Rugamonas rubra TaxID=758825 RepID=A0A1I4JCA2_9BURK|nr:T6SS immunity protein Tli4 family protein [Rugamonas rubra]SFL64198.1 hypothetical protein SAMN02982985_00923 [Rugamonas rubra]
MTFPRTSLSIAVLALLLFVSNDNAMAKTKIIHKSHAEKAKLMLDRMKTMCVGRFLIDVPEVAATSYRPAFLSGWEISSYSTQTEQEFMDWMGKTEADLKMAKDKDGKPSVYLIEPVSVGGFSGNIYVSGIHSESWLEEETKVTGEVAKIFGWIRRDSVSFALIAERRQPKETKELLQIISQIRPLADGEIPAEPGFCIERGIIRDPLTADQLERATMIFGFHDHPDVAISFDTAAGLDGAPTLLERSEHNSVRLATPSAYHLFRGRVRNIGDIEGQEYLERVREHNGVESHNFNWETINYDRNDVYKPQLVLEFSDGFGRPGEQLNASLSDKAVLELWDKMLTSLRVRPTTIPKPVVPEPPPPATQAYAGTACPQTGWWRCFEGDDKVKVFRGHTQYYRKGVGMEQATVLLPRTLWQVVKREQPTFQSELPTLWKLVEKKEIPK